MVAQSSTSADGSASEQESETEQDDDRQSSDVLLEESRTRATRQLGQLRQIDSAAVWTVRLGLLLGTLVAAVARLTSMRIFGLFGILGAAALVGSLVSGLFVYATASRFLGSGPAELPVRYDQQPVLEEPVVSLLDRYESGIVDNRRLLQVNSLALATSRLLLSVAIVLIALSFSIRLV